MLNLKHATPLRQTGEKTPKRSKPSCYFSAYNKQDLPQSKAPVFGIANQNHALRKPLESLIKQGFKRSHNARIHSFMPHLFYVFNLKQQAVLGVRHAHEPLFLEQYFQNQPKFAAVCEQESHEGMPKKSADSLKTTGSLEATLANKGLNIARRHLVEIGNLYSTSPKSTLQLLIYTLYTLALNQKTHIIFTGIPTVTRIFNRFNVPLTRLCHARQDAVKDGPDDWGSYYQKCPQVMLLSINDALNAIDASPKLRALRDELSRNLAIPSASHLTSLSFPEMAPQLAPILAPPLASLLPPHSTVGGFAS